MHIMLRSSKYALGRFVVTSTLETGEDDDPEPMRGGLRPSDLGGISAPFDFEPICTPLPR